MPRNGSGQFLPANSSFNPAINGVLATAGDWQALLNDLSAALTQSVSRDGQSPMQGNLNLSNNKITGLAAGTGATDAATWAQLFGASTQADIASAATTDIGVQNTSFLRVTGTTTITSFGSNYRGPRFLTFESAVTLTHSSTLVLPGNANITTAAGDSLIVIPGATLGTADKWIVVAYEKNAPSFTARAWVNFNGTGTPAIRASGNVSSITDIGIGDYQVNFATAMPDANYSMTASGMFAGSPDGQTPVIGPRRGITAYTTTSIRVQASISTAGALDDVLFCNLAFFR